MVETNIMSRVQEATTTLYERGNLSYALQKHQVPLHQLLWDSVSSDARTVAVNCSRRFTKTSTSLVFCFEYAIKNPGSSIVFVAPVRAEIKKIVKSIVYAHILKNVIMEKQPEYIESRHEFNFSNGSVLCMFGSNGGNIDSARGHAADLIVVDEMAQIDDCEYVMTSVLFPMTLTTRGLIVGLSTPSLTTDHYFYTYCQNCKLIGTYFEKTIYDNTSLTQRDIDAIAQLSGGYDSTAFKREYLCKWVRDEQRTIIPEWTSSQIGKYIPNEYYQYYYHFVGIDWGVRDKTAMLFATFDFMNQKLYIEREVVINGHDVTVDRIASICKQIERELWGDYARNVFRTGDSSDLIVIQTLASQYSYNVTPVKKSSLVEMVAEVRTHITNIVIDPSCVNLINDVEDSIWDEQRKSFQRTSRGHADALAALIYLWRTAKKYLNSNPIPPTHGDTFETARYRASDTPLDAVVWKTALNRR